MLTNLSPRCLAITPRNHEGTLNLPFVCSCTHASLLCFFFYGDVSNFFFGGIEARLCTAARTHLYSVFLFLAWDVIFFFARGSNFEFRLQLHTRIYNPFFFWREIVRAEGCYDNTAICMSSYSYIPGSASWRSWSTTALAPRVGWVYHTQRSCACACVRVRACTWAWYNKMNQIASGHAQIFVIC
jgi:hypothetical protein